MCLGCNIQKNICSFYQKPYFVDLRKGFCCFTKYSSGDFIQFTVFHYHFYLSKVANVRCGVSLYRN